MRKLIRLLSRLFFLALIIIILIMIFKTVSFSSKQITGVEPTPKVTIDKNAVNRLSKAVQLKTIATQTVVDTFAFDKLMAQIEANYPLVHQELEREIFNDFTLMYKWKGKDTRLQPVLLMGHTDVVPVEESSEDDWTEPPFSGTIKDGLIWGRGTLDDKLNVFGLLEAMEHLLKEDLLPIRDIYFVFGHNEEVGGLQGAMAAAQYFEKNNIQFDFVLDEGQMVLNDALKGLDSPLAMIGIGEKGYTSLTLSVQLEKGGHSSMPPPETAVGILSSAISKIQNNPFPMQINGATEQLFKHVGPEMNLLYKTLFANLWITKGLIKNQLGKDPAASALMRTTTAPTMLRAGFKENVLPTKASAKINFRIIPGETIESVRKHVANIINDDRVVVQVSNPEFSSDPTPLSETESFGYRVLQRTIQEIYPDVVVAPSLVVAATDSRHFTKVANNVYRFQPIQIDRKDLSKFHGIDECISVENYERAIRFYRQLILNIGK